MRLLTIVLLFLILNNCFSLRLHGPNKDKSDKQHDNPQDSNSTDPAVAETHKKLGKARLDAQKKMLTGAAHAP
jgi:hypothetical protein